jgi:hypothetical protein
LGCIGLSHQVGLLSHIALKLVPLSFGLSHDDCAGMLKLVMLVLQLAYGQSSCALG